MPTKPTIVEMDMGKLDETLRRAEAVLSREDYARLKVLAESYAYLTELVGDKNTSIARLRKLLFGAKTEKTAVVIGERNNSQSPPMQDATPSAVLPEGNADAAVAPQSTTDAEKAAKEPWRLRQVC